jgi:uncharacterized protein YigA (DUF484 family)
MSPVTQAALPGTTAEPVDRQGDPQRELAAESPVTAPADPRQEAAAELKHVQQAVPELNDVQVADWLHGHPDFFDQHADLLSEVRIRHPHGGRTISLVERQVLVLRERNKALEARMAELIRIGQENDGIGVRLQQLTRELLSTTDQAQLPAVLIEGLKTGFGVPQVAIRLWGIDGIDTPFGDDVSADARRRVDELSQPYCGPNSHPEAAGWLPGAGENTASMALLALRPAPRAGAFGLLVLGSDDAGRFQAGMGTAFLERIAEIASASLARLLP